MLKITIARDAHRKFFGQSRGCVNQRKTKRLASKASKTLRCPGILLKQRAQPRQAEALNQSLNG